MIYRNFGTAPTQNKLNVKADMKRKIRFKLKTVINGEIFKTSSDFTEYSVECYFTEIAPVIKIIEVNS